MPRTRTVAAPATQEENEQEVVIRADGTVPGEEIIEATEPSEPQEMSPSEGIIVDVDENMPWGQWPIPSAHNGNINEVKARLHENSIVLDVYQEDHFSETLGYLDGSSMRQLGKYSGFPVDFVQKLSPELRAEIITERLKTAQYNGFTFLVQENKITNMMPDFRQVLPYSHSAQYVYDKMSEQHGSLEVKECRINEGKMITRFETGKFESVTRKVGDTLSYGVQLIHDYGSELSLSVYATRLSCLNGATTQHDLFPWKSRTHGSPDHQLNWLGGAVEGSIIAFNQLVARAKVMSETKFEGDPHTILAERAKALRIPRNLVPALMAAFDEDPGETEWDLLQPITRVATHSENVSENRRRYMQGVAGDFVREFDVVNASLPLAIANRVGARLIQDIESIGASVE